MLTSEAISNRLAEVMGWIKTPPSRMWFDPSAGHYTEFPYVCPQSYEAMFEPFTDHQSLLRERLVDLEVV